MTQELVLGVLLTGLAGLIWVMTISILADGQSASKRQDPGTSTEEGPEQGDDAYLPSAPSKQHTIAA
jgi:hypothetical protein